MTVYADVKILDFSELDEALDVLMPGNGEIGMKSVAANARVLLEPGELVQKLAIHEHVAGARRQVESVVSHLQRLRYAIPEKCFVHDDFRAQLFRIGAEAAVQVADAGCLDAQAIAFLRYELATSRVVHVDRDGVAQIAR